MKIAIVTDDGQSISAHFGRARAYAVLTVRDGVVIERELRPKSAPHLEPQSGHDDSDALPRQPGRPRPSRRDDRPDR